MGKHVKKLLFVFIIIVFTIGIKLLFFNKLPPPRNLILISVDTLRADHMGIYGYEKNTTPNIDKWAKNAVVFENAYTILPLTLNSFYTLFLGRKDALEKRKIMVDKPKIFDLNENARNTFPEIFQKNNFSTAAFVTNFVIGKNYNEFFRRGFDKFSFVNTTKQATDDDNDLFNDDYQNSIEVTEKSIDWLKRNKDEKFFLWIHYSTPHIPYNPNDSYVCAVDTNCQAALSFLKEKRWNEEVYQCDPITMTSNSTIQAMKSLYDGEIRSTDEQIGRFLDFIKDQRLDKNSLVVFYGDHGEGFDHNTFGHGKTVYDSALHIPLIIANPTRTVPHRTENLLDNTDIFPTIFDLMEIRFDKDMATGISFAKKLGLLGFFSPTREYIYSLTSPHITNRFAVFNKTYKYIKSFNNKCLYKQQKDEFYNIKKDKEEIFNIINNEEIKAIKNHMKSLLWQKIANIK